MLVAQSALPELDSMQSQPCLHAPVVSRTVAEVVSSRPDC